MGDLRHVDGRPVTGWAWARIAAYAVVVGVGVAGFWIDHLQDIDRCRESNASVERSVRIVVDAALASVDDPDAPGAEAFRADVDRRLAAARVLCT